MAINATDNEELATELWGENKYWDEDRQQYLPKKEGDDVSVGSNSRVSSSETEKSDETKNSDPLSSAQTTEPTSSPKTGGTTAHSTGGSGKVKRSPGR